ncbi:hypothetical protein [Streptomyces spiramenti]
MAVSPLVAASPEIFDASAAVIRSATVDSASPVLAAAADEY